MAFKALLLGNLQKLIAAFLFVPKLFSWQQRMYEMQMLIYLHTILAPTLAFKHNIWPIIELSR